jgi:glycosidase
MGENMHNSAVSRFRNPVGAVQVGQTIQLCFQGEEQLQEVILRVFTDDVPVDHPMKLEDGLWQYQLHTRTTTGLMWYHFVLRYPWGERYYGLPAGRNTGYGVVYDHEPPSFQITVYAQKFSTPDWCKHGIMYQIFPDRFARGDLSNLPKGLAYHRKMGRQVVDHERWNEMPLYQPLPGQKDYSPCDFFGGDLKGIENALPYFKELGVSILYLNPIVEADSNHRYNTADYKKVDPILGTNEDFVRLCRKAKKEGIRIVLDGVYSHTGSDSVYFNKNGNYETLGAYQGKESPYYKWYDFQNGNRDVYKSWWGFQTLPEVNEMEPTWQDFVITGKESVFAHWLSLGASGYRLDVADELPDEVIALMRQATKRDDKSNLLLGEVWEDATTKESYGVKRQYALGAGLDSVMNYPFKEACLNFLLGRGTAEDLKYFLLGQETNYPKPMYYCLMNLLSSHDIPRMRTVLGTGLDGSTMTREQQATYAIGEGQEQEGASLAKLATALQFAVPGMPSIYYGDEYGMQGFKDPLNRGTFCQRDPEMYEITKKYAQLRKKEDCLRTGHAVFFAPHPDVIGVFRFIVDGKDAFGRHGENGSYVFLINRSKQDCSIEVDLRSLQEGLDAPQWQRMMHQLYTSAKVMDDGSMYVGGSQFGVTVAARSTMVLKLLK